LHRGHGRDDAKAQRGGAGTKGISQKETKVTKQILPEMQSFGISAAKQALTVNEQYLQLVVYHINMVVARGKISKVIHKANYRGLAQNRR
jgi:hypothetical protein